MSPQVSLSLKEIYDNLCPKCKKKVRDIVKDKVVDESIKQAIEGEEKRGDNI